MGVPLNLAVVLREWLHRAGGTGRLLSFGAQSLQFDVPAFLAATGDARFTGSAESYYAACGYGESLALDVSGFEGAQVILDLNDDRTPAELVGRFDAVFNGGTIEHVFHVPNALSHLTRMLRTDGLAIHLSPCHNWVDHGFYQFSPTLFFDYYEAARFQPLESAVFLFDRDGQAPWRVLPAPPEAFGAGLSGTFDGSIGLHLFVARKTADALDRPTPVQSLYQTGPPTGRHQTRWFPPFSMRNGMVTATTHYVERVLGPFKSDGGFCWTCQVEEWQHHSDTAAFPLRSPILVSEDGVMLGPAHSRHDQIRAEGRGRYSHWGTTIYCSTSDGTDPNKNGRKYVAMAPVDQTRSRL